jgi:hypothetical protein
LPDCLNITQGQVKHILQLGLLCDTNNDTVFDHDELFLECGEGSDLALLDGVYSCTSSPSVYTMDQALEIYTEYRWPYIVSFLESCFGFNFIFPHGGGMVRTELGPIPYYSVREINDDQGAPQSRAYFWLLNHPYRDMLSEEWRLHQLFALVTFYYSFNGNDWPDGDKEGWLDYEQAECSWGSNDGKLCFFMTK